MKTTKHITFLAMGATIVLLATGCASDGGDEQGATGEPIIVAGISTASSFPEGPPAAQAVFDDYNENGGFNGRPIEYQTFDDKGDPSASATAARDALSSKAIALVGTSSVSDGTQNHTTWEENGIVSIPAVGVDPFSYTTPNIAPVMAGPNVPSYTSLYYGSEELGLESICIFTVLDDATTKAEFTRTVDLWKEETGSEPALLDDTLTRGQASYAGNVSKITSSGCDGIFINDIAPAVTQLLAEAGNLGLDLPVLTVPSVYSDEFAQTLVYDGDLYVPTEFAPFTEEDEEANAAWRETMDNAGVAKTAFAQGGYLSAKAFIHVLETIEGDVTRESFTAAARGMDEPFDTEGMTGTPWIFGEGDAHHSITATWQMKLEANSGVWTSLGPWFNAAEHGWTPGPDYRN